MRRDRELQTVSGETKCSQHVCRCKKICWHAMPWFAMAWHKSTLVFVWQSCLAKFTFYNCHIVFCCCCFGYYVADNIGRQNQHLLSLLWNYTDERMVSFVAALWNIVYVSGTIQVDKWMHSEDKLYDFLIKLLIS